MSLFIGKLWSLFEKLVRAVVGFFLRLFKIELTKEQWQGFIQFVKFCLVGVSNTVISLGIYYIFVAFDPALYIVGNAVGFIAGVLNAYFWNSRFVFGKKDERAKTLVKTFISYGATLITGTGVLYLLVDILGVSAFIAPLINVAVTIPINFVLNKLWVMK